MEQNWIKKIRVLTVSLIFSGALNIGLLAAFAAFMLHNRSASFEFAGALQKGEPASRGASSNFGALQTMGKLSFRELVALLTNRELAEEGYTKRDLALAALVAFRHFNLEKAIGSAPLQKRIVSIGSDSVELYPGLTEEQFEAAIRFAYREKWPLTAKGLLELLQKLPAPREESLCAAFSTTSEFYALQLLFQKSDAPQEATALIDLAIEGGWEVLSGFAKEQAQLLDLSVERRRRLLLSYLAHNSRAAAKILLKTDAAFVAKRLDDPGICDLLALLEEKEEAFCQSLLASPRSDAVRAAAAKKLAQYAGESMPASIDVASAASRFCPKAEVAMPAPAPQPARYYTVSEGESLWKIARQHKVKVDDIIQVNGIENGMIFPGMTLRIPD